MEPYPDLGISKSGAQRVYLARDGALPRHVIERVTDALSLSSEGWSPTPTRTAIRRRWRESI